MLVRVPEVVTNQCQHNKVWAIIMTLENITPNDYASVK